MTLAPLKDLSDPDLSPPELDESGRSSQNFLVETVVRSGSLERTTVAAGRDIYAVSVPLVVEALERILNKSSDLRGVMPIGEISNAKDFLESLSPEHLSVKFNER